MSMSIRSVVPSIGQRLLWYVDHYRGDDGALNCPVLLRLRGPLDVAALAAALDRVVSRHEALRTTFSGRGQSLSQLIHDHRPVRLEHVDISRAPDPEAEARAAIGKNLATRIDPESGPLRVNLWRLSPTEHALCLNMHHLVTDAWSCGVIVKDLESLSARREAPNVGAQYSQFVQWQNDWLAGDAVSRCRADWRTQLDGLRVPPLPALNADTGGSRRTASAVSDIDRETTRALSEAARTHKTTLYAVMLAVYYALLHQMTGETDLPVASVFANRMRPEFHHTVGFLANVVILRVRIRTAMRMLDLLRQTHDTVMEAFLHQQLPFHVIGAGVVSEAMRRPDDLVFQMLSTRTQGFELANARAEVLIPDGIGSRFELELTVIPQHDGLKVVLFHNLARVSAARARDLIAAYASVAAAFARNPGMGVAELSSTHVRPRS
jgi:NRPS condensation-like uncharacterized protein